MSLKSIYRKFVSKHGNKRYRIMSVFRLPHAILGVLFSYLLLAVVINYYVVLESDMYFWVFVYFIFLHEIYFISLYMGFFDY